MSYAVALGAVLIATLVNAWAGSHFDLADCAMIYLLAGVAVASRLSRGPSIVAVLAGVAALDFIFVEPRYSLPVHDRGHLATIGVMLVVSLLVSGFTLRIREQAELALERERQTNGLFALSRKLAVTSGVGPLAQVALARARAHYGMEAAVLISGGTHPAASTASFGALSEGALALAQRAMELGQTVGAESELAPSLENLAIPMPGLRGAVGTFLFRLGRSLPSPSLVRALEALVAQTAPAIERGLLANEAEEARVSVETERIRNTLLAGVSHDLRTPLASIGGSASVLLDPSAVLDAEQRRELLESIRDESSRLTRMVRGLLDLARLESGALSVDKQWCPIEEVLASAVGHLQTALADRPVHARLGEGDDVLLAAIDPVLFEEVLINLLENAAKYSPSGSKIEVRAWSDERELTMEIEDQGIGLVPGEEQRIFEKFYRAGDGQRAPGSGLGLAVCDAIVRAHGGRIAARAADRGAIFAIALPHATGAPA